jgi:hypothetical protein
LTGSLVIDAFWKSPTDQNRSSSVRPVWFAMTTYLLWSRKRNANVPGWNVLKSDRLQMAGPATTKLSCGIVEMMYESATIDGTKTSNANVV